MIDLFPVPMPDNVRECAVAVQAPTDARAERGVAMPLDYWRSIAAGGTNLRQAVCNPLTPLSVLVA
jgi:hypothetical protein